MVAYFIGGIPMKIIYENQNSNLSSKGSGITHIVDSKVGFRKILEPFEFEIPITWKNNRGVCNLNGTTRGIITLLNSGTNGQYEQFSVRIKNIISGKTIAFKYFPFYKYLPISTENRIDDQLNIEVTQFLIWQNENNEIDVRWHIAIPKSTRPICAAIEEFLEEWK